MRSTGPLLLSEAHQAAASGPRSSRVGPRQVRQPLEDLTSRTFVLLGSFFLLTSCVAVVASRGLVADGAYYFITILQQPWPTTFEHGRLAAHALTQWPLVLAIRVGLTDLTTLRLIHSAGLFYLGPLHLLLCWWFVPKGEERELFWPLLSLFAGSINAWFVAMTEAHVLTWLFWPMVIFLIHGELRHRLQAAVFALLVIASTLAYETMALQGLLLAGLAGARRRGETAAGPRWMWTAITGCFLLGAGVAAYFAVNPRSPENRRGFLAGMLQFAGTGREDLNYPVLLSFGVLALVAIVLLVGPFRRSIFLGVLGSLAAAGILVALSPIFKPDSLRPLQQFQARAWIGLLPVGLTLVMLYLRHRRPRPFAFKMALGFLLVLGLTQITWHMVATAQWYGYTRIFREELRRHTGFIAYQASDLARERVGIQALRNLTWYTNGVMSIILAPSGRVSAIIGGPRGIWQPFDPTDPKALPDLHRYGVDYSRYLDSLGAR